MIVLAEMMNLIIPFQVHSMDKNTICFISYCMLHQLHLACSATLSSSMVVVSQLYSLARLLRCPGYLPRLLNAIMPAIYHDIDIEYVVGIPCTDRLESYKRHNIEVLVLCGVDPTTQEAQNLLCLLNGNWKWHKFYHLCSGFGCPCNSFQSNNPKHQLCVTIAGLLRSCLFSSMPPVPIMSRWTRVAATLSWFCLLCNVHRALPKVFRSAFDTNFCKEILERAAQTHMPDGCVSEPSMGGADREKWILQVSTRFLLQVQ